MTGVRVLVAEDDPDTRGLLSMLLGLEGASVISARSGNEAWSLFPGMRPDIVLSDIEMPDGDGLSLVRKIRSLDDKAGGLTPAIALSGTADWNKTVMEGFHVAFRKPVDPTELVHTVEEFTCTSASEADGRATVFFPHDSVLLIRFEGYIRRCDIEAVMVTVVEQMAQGPCEIISDLRAMTGFSPSVPNIAEHHMWRDRANVTQVYIVGGSLVAKVASLAAAKVLGFPMKLVDELPPEARIG